MGDSGENCSVSRGVELMLLGLQADGVKPATVKWYRQRLARFVGMYGTRDVRGVSIDDVRAYIVAMQQLEFSPYTMFAVVRSRSSVVQVAV